MQAAPPTMRRMFSTMDFLSLAGASSVSSAPASRLAERMFSVIYSRKMNSSTAAPAMEKLPLRESRNSAHTAAMSRMPLGAKLLLSTAMGMKMMLMARIMAVLQMTEPMALP